MLHPRASINPCAPKAKAHHHCQADTDQALTHDSERCIFTAMIVQKLFTTIDTEFEEVVDAAPQERAIERKDAVAPQFGWMLVDGRPIRSEQHMCCVRETGQQSQHRLDIFHAIVSSSKKEGQALGKLWMSDAIKAHVRENSESNLLAHLIPWPIFTRLSLPGSLRAVTSKKVLHGDID
jgi:hypothetical protein